MNWFLLLHGLIPLRVKVCSFTTGVKQRKEKSCFWRANFKETVPIQQLDFNDCTAPLLSLLPFPWGHLIPCRKTTWAGMLLLLRWFVRTLRLHLQHPKIPQYCQVNVKQNTGNYSAKIALLMNSLWIVAPVFTEGEPGYRTVIFALAQGKHWRKYRMATQESSVLFLKSHHLFRKSWALCWSVL